jgi:F0F1-type ATP synthase assembly protein I
MYIGLGIVLLVIGAILYFAVSASVAGISLSTVGLILMIGGGLAIILSFVMQASRRSSGVTTTRETHVDPSTGSSVERTDVDPS